MKILFPVLLAALLCVHTVHAGKIHIMIEKDTPAQTTYEKVEEAHTGTMDKLSCYKPGDKICKWERQPNKDIPLENANAATLSIQSTIDAAIDKGHTSGSFDSDMGVVSWTHSGNIIEIHID